MTESGGPGENDPHGPGEAAERIAKRLARAGLCSRRDAERLVAEGRVAVDGAVATAPGLRVAPDAAIAVDGAPVGPPHPSRLWRYHKPRGLICTNRDPGGRATVFDRLPETLPRVVTAGRLDLDSEGLLLLTNDGALARRLERSGWLRRYRVRAHGRVDEKALAALGRGVAIDGAAYGPIQATLDRVQGANAWLTVSLREGRNREVRRVMGRLGLQVGRLIRTAFGPFQLGGLARASVAEIPARTVAEQLGDAHRRR